MGSEVSQEEYDSIALQLYEETLWRSCHYPDVGIDESLLKYSGLNSNSELQTYFNELVNTVPGYVQNLGSSLSSLNSVPNAVGLGALVLSMIMELCIKGTTERNDGSYSMFRRVFGEEKASAVRDTMLEYLKRHQMFMENKQDLLQELQNLERRLSHDLTILKNSLVLDGQMSTRGFKIWVNGASFHVQMLIHKARLNSQTGHSSSQYINTVNVAIDLYLRDLEELLQTYKTYKTSITSFYTTGPYGFGSLIRCHIDNTELNCGYSTYNLDFCAFWRGQQSRIAEAYVNLIFTKHEPITGLKSHFLNVKNNLNSLINQHYAFTLPPAA